MTKEKHRGSLKFYNPTKKYGFIKTNSGTTDIYFNYDGLSDPQSESKLVINMPLLYYTASAPQGKKAIEIEIDYNY